MSIFEGILGIFQDAHFSKKLSIYEQAEHLQGTALYPVPFTRKVVLSLVSASIAFIHVFPDGHDS